MHANKKEKSFFQRLMVYASKLFSTAIIVILVLIGIFLVYYVATAQIQKSKGEEFNPKFTLYTIVSGSMEPIIKVYDVIFTQRVDDLSTVKVGDVITFISTSYISKDMVVTHRVLEIRKIDGKYEFVTKGDHNPTADSATAKGEDVIGKVMFKIPQLGRLQQLIATKMGWVIVVLLPALGIIIYDILKLFRIMGVKKVSDNITNIGGNANEAIIKEENKKIDAIFENIIKESETLIEEENIKEKPEEETENEEKILELDYEETKMLKEPTPEITLEITKIEPNEHCSCNDKCTTGYNPDCHCQHSDCHCNELPRDDSEDADFTQRKDLVDTLRDLKVLTTSFIKKEEIKEELDLDLSDNFKFFEKEEVNEVVNDETKTSEQTKTQIEGIVSRYYSDFNKDSDDKQQGNNRKTNNNQKYNHNKTNHRNNNQKYNPNRNNNQNKNRSNSPNNSNNQQSNNQNRNNNQKYNSNRNSSPNNKNNQQSNNQNRDNNQRHDSNKNNNQKHNYNKGNYKSNNQKNKQNRSNKKY